MKTFTLASIMIWLASAALLRSAPLESPEPRPPATDADWRFWLQNMVWYHRFTPDEIQAACGLAPGELASALRKYSIDPAGRPTRSATAPLLVLPYPGGRHPRIGFLDGAVRPQRETKISVFTPWDSHSYVVVDVPEAVWSNLGLIYLAHTHVPTVFDKEGVKLSPMEWNRNVDGTYDIARRLPNGVSFGTRVMPMRDSVRMELTLTNGTKETLSDLRVQNCVMLKGTSGFTLQTNSNKVFAKPYMACHSEDGNKWVITGWDPCHRVWANAPVPCLHADPKFPDCPPGQTRRLRGWLSFYQGTNIHAELERIEKIGWRE